ncbi:hypothetical protein FQN60_013991 [Etheostoma spectabile]|uniref:Uncharacterized protein n=1 Tax=Etheostoma spectabile TaxID=54343 RepID=A0A5J5D7K6_9PERO|nr:hypothetical protein FQN60_013991 [Etheostoma spectabile]
MAGRLLLLRACTATTLQLRSNVGARPLHRALATAKGVPTDEEQATGLERRALQALKLGKDPYSMLKPKEYAGTKEDPHIVPGIGTKRMVRKTTRLLCGSGFMREMPSAVLPVVPTISWSTTSCPIETKFNKSLVQQVEAGVGHRKIVEDLPEEPDGGMVRPELLVEGHREVELHYSEIVDGQATDDPDQEEELLSHASCINGLFSHEDHLP